MNLLWITAIYPSANHPAEGVFHRTQAEALTALGAKVKVIAPVPWVPSFICKFNRRWRSYGDYPARYEQNGVEVFRPKFFAHPRHFFYGIPHRFMAAAIRRIGMGPPDLIHAHIAFPCGLAARHVSERCGVPYVLTLHGSDVHSYPRINAQCRRRFLRAIRGARSVCAVGPSLAQKAEQLSGVRPNVQPIGIDLKNFKNLPSRSEARQRLQLPADRYVVLYVGRLVEAKGVRDLIEAVRQTYPRDVLAVLVGDGPLLERASAEQHIRAVGAVDNKHVPLYLAAADTLILPSHKEGLPTVLVEAGACAVPVIATRIDGVVDLLGSDRGHLIDSRSPRAIAEGIKHLMSHKAYAAAIATNLQRHVSERYDVETNARELLRFCEEALQKKGQTLHDPILSP
jgi:teichuronic acid biosynthesis glycosyltransferase TuaC